MLCLRLNALREEVAEEQERKTFLQAVLARVGASDGIQYNVYNIYLYIYYNIYNIIYYRI